MYKFEKYITQINNFHLELNPMMDSESANQAKNSLKDFSSNFIPFVFDDCMNTPIEGVKINGPVDATILDLPFKNVWIETKNKPLWINEREKASIEGFGIREHNPGIYTYILCIKKDIKDLFMISVYSDLELKSCYSIELFDNLKTLRVILYHYLNGLKKSHTGTEKIAVKFKLKNSDGTKEYRKIKEIVHVTNNTINYSESFGNVVKNIEWSHRFAVSGHWRTLNKSTLGLDREGKRVVEGFTWISDYVKGADVLPFIKKPRFIDTQKNI